MTSQYALPLPRKQNIQVFLAADGLAGLRLIEFTSFDAAIIDMLIPGMDGIATVRKLIKLDPMLPFIAMSGKCFTDCKLAAPDFIGMAVRLGATPPFRSRSEQSGSCPLWTHASPSGVLTSSRKRMRWASMETA